MYIGMTTSLTMSAVMNLKQVVASEDIMYTKMHGHQLLVYAEEKTVIHATNICTTPFYNSLSEGNYFTGKVSQLPTNP